MKRIFSLTILTLLIAAPAIAKIDLVTLPKQDAAQITIYNSADLTLVRQSRNLTLKEGTNKLQFSWANTLIDPTSLEMLPLKNADKIDIADLTFPPRVKNLGLWNINSEIGGKTPVEITYLTSGLSWRAFYMGTLTEDEKTMRLQGYVRVTNNSGEDYENTQTRLIVGKVNILDKIADLARREQPYGRPGQPQPYPAPPIPMKSSRGIKEGMMVMDFAMAGESVMEEKEIIKEGLSEYFLYTIEGKETINNGWSKRLPSFDIADVPVENLYKYQLGRYGNNVIRFLSFKNDTDHELGETPIPGGLLKVYRSVDDQNHLSYTGQSSFKYIPVDEDVELSLGAVSNVVVEPKLMDIKYENHRFREGSVVGWDELRKFKIEVRNTRDIPIRVEIKRAFQDQYWKIENSGDFGDYEKYDLRTVKYTLKMEPNSKKTFEYNLREFFGTRHEDWRE